MNATKIVNEDSSTAPSLTVFLRVLDSLFNDTQNNEAYLMPKPSLYKNSCHTI